MSTSLDKINNILKTIDEYSDNSMEDNIKNRLDKCLQLYLKDLNTSYYRIIDNINKKSVIKELSKCE
ncbi:MAG: hypothetical protein IJH34_09850 [Romboutsia sp.]|nr:hypothetical protein [Romboutsia sp.]